MKPDYYPDVTVDFSPVSHEFTDVKAKRVRLFIKPYCTWCHRAMSWLDNHRVEYETIDVIADESAYAEMIRLSGQELAPVIDVDGEVLGDFGPDQLAEFWKRLEDKHATTHR